MQKTSTLERFDDYPRLGAWAKRVVGVNVVVGGDQILAPSIPYQESIPHDEYKGTDRDPLDMLQRHGGLVVEILGVESVVVAPI